MNLGYDKPLYLLAFDHRASFERDLFHTSPPVSDKVRAGIIDAKEVIYEGFVEAGGRGVPREAAGVLTDEEYGASVARQARRAGDVLAMPVEKSGQAEFQFEYGDDFGRHIEEFDPTFSKVLVRYNPDGDPELNRRQAGRLARLSKWLHDRDRRFLFELLIPPTPEQLKRARGDQRRYDREIRPDLEVRVLHALQDADVEPDIWKIEGLDSAEACEQVVAAAHRRGRDGVRCVVLGRGADEAQVLEWLRIAAPVPGFDGFAVGRTIWEQPLRDMIAGTIGRSDAVHQIADHYVENVNGYRLAAGLPGLSPGGTVAVPPIRLMLADVDGTLVTQDKVLTNRAIAAVAKLKQAGILFAITSGRPPRGMSMLVEPLQLTTTIAAFNGGVYVRPDMSVIEQQTIPDDVTPTVIDLLGAHGLDVWVYRGADWFLRDPKAPHVAREDWTVKFDPTVVDSFASVSDGVAKITGVSDDDDAVQKGVDAVRERFGDHVSAARSQPYYGDVTNPDANKGAVAQYLSRTYQIPEEQIATIGDQPNDVLMFARSGLSIAMGNASHEVQAAARRVTTSNEDEGFANAVERYVLP